MNHGTAKAKELPSLLVDAIRTGEVMDGEGKIKPLDSNVSEAEAMLLFEAVRQLRPERSVEVGLANGISTLAILGALEANGFGLHTVIDPFQSNYGDTGIAMVARAGLETRWEFHRKFAEEVIPGLPPIQFAFIDASHLFDLTLMEFVLVDKKLEVGGVVGFHDLWMPSLQAVYRYIVRNRSYEVWNPLGQRPATRNRGGWRRLVRRMLTGIDPVRKILTPEFAAPWAEEGLGNLILLRKTAEDHRGWTFHEPF
ncbi:MAG: putative O-methyltransferase YrrM [Verrucomicrobia bacterium]|jgi:predicted O-methyltransferase YrrM|nr:MAG: putative O-methyltransferase YrrM [Verrucomicrobiota bacterium]